MIVNGRAIAKEILAHVRADMAGVPPVVVRAITISPSPATLSYLSMKRRRATDAGMTLELLELPQDATEGDIIAALGAEGADALIVQLPLPPYLDTKAVLDAIPVSLDADVLSADAHEAFESSSEALLPPVVDAVREILARANVTLAGKRAVVVGNGWLVGEPTAAWLAREGAETTIVTLEEGDLADLKEADLVVLGAGSPGLVTPDLLKEGVVLIDAGTSESGGAIVGDADPACADRASVFTPVPGGVGPIAVACLFRNAGKLALRRAQKAL